MQRITITRALSSRTDERFVAKKKVVLSTTKDNVSLVVSDRKKNEQNLKQILIYSNANPIRNKDGLGYMCSFCTEQYPEPMDLKKHFKEEHNRDKSAKSLIAKLFDRVVKLDVTHLKCLLCNIYFSKLNEFISHLKIEHDRVVYTDVKSMIVTFKFDTPELRCAVCSVEYASFKLLQDHTNTHYRNYVCDLCGASFVTERLLNCHVNRHSTGEYNCEQCEKVFSTTQKLREHERRTHLGLGKRNKCQFCDERFVDYWKKIDHMVKEHGIPPVLFECQACDRTFQTRKTLQIHTKKVHLLERENKCLECEKTFFSKSTLKLHMSKHTGIKQFRCDICFKAYGRKNTLIQHMRIHADDRRFACVHCGMAFVQKCTLRSHMRTKHGEV